MKLSNLSNKDNFIYQHPYALSAFLCFLTVVFTFCDQQYFSSESVIILSFFLIVFVCRKIYKSDTKAKPAKFIASTAVILAAGILFSIFQFKGLLFLLGGTVIFASVFFNMYRKKQITDEILETSVMIFSAFAMVAYVLYTLCSTRQFDVSSITSDEYHAGYINYFYDNLFKLPDFDPREKWMFFHPPLFHWTSALWIHLLTAFGIPYEQAFETIQIIPLFCSFCTVITSHKIFKHFHLRGYALVISTSIVVFCNATIMLSGSINNDTMSIAFEVGALYCALKWYRDKNIKNILQIALCTGFGMTTKLSVWMAAPAIAFIFIYAFFKDIKNFKKYIGQYSLFLLICAPLGLWFPIYNCIRFGVPLGYVPPADESLYIGDYSTAQRLFDFGWYPFSSSNAQNINREYLEFNPLIALIKSSTDLQRLDFYRNLFKVSSAVQFFSTAIIGTASFIFMLCSPFLKKLKTAIEKKIMLIIFYFTMMISYYIFCIQFPYSCSQNIRYIYPVVIVGAVFAGMLFQYNFKNAKLGKIIRILISVTTILFCFSSIAAQCIMGTIV